VTMLVCDLKAAYFSAKKRPRLQKKYRKGKKKGKLHPRTAYTFETTKPATGSIWESGGEEKDRKPAVPARLVTFPSTRDERSILDRLQATEIQLRKGLQIR